ncbi:MAG: hypothetical protein JOZ31_22425 [Verrucomicrobia bacterium]|nr:hypothetical protein [Verrucomicrobiota bacterium]MBV8484595.1 hypothetical protein [Verrucomicrobiota bacterium]
MLLVLPFLLLFDSSAAMANGLGENLLTFVQNAVPEGRIVFCGEVDSNETAYDLFVLEHEAARGVLVITGGSTDPFGRSPQVLFADTSFDVALSQTLIPPEVLSEFYALLGITRSPSIEAAVTAPAEDIYPVGAALNTVLGPISGFTFRSNSTLGILQELERSNAIPVSPSAAPIGSVLVCPTIYAPTGPVSLGSVVILGSDHQVYGPDFRKGGTWTCFGRLENWIEKYGAQNQLFGFLLRACPERAST